MLVEIYSPRNLRMGSSCLAKHSDDLWHLANIESMGEGDDSEEAHVCVRYRKFNLVKPLPWTDIYPLDNPHDDDTDEDSDDSSDLSTLSSGGE